MSMAMIRSAARRVGSRAQVQVSRRAFSTPGASMEEYAAESAKWKKISVMAVPVIAIFGVVQLTKDHSHHHTGPQKYNKIRSKPFPWGNGQCGLFDGECKRKAAGH
eukprot:TRINITY_DN11968_c0_g1_i1.p1 TRINITY_DN11968_c0_g1~~TRINITY_DN11968_c0_g1_i1.p1  ORF type:complete len:124 (-),score=52.79 TRINITY_DN11968_c0_g1_i1:84-401(-)